MARPHPPTEAQKLLLRAAPSCQFDETGDVNHAADAVTRLLQQNGG